MILVLGGLKVSRIIIKACKFISVCLFAELKEIFLD